LSQTGSLIYGQFERHTISPTERATNGSSYSTRKSDRRLCAAAAPLPADATQAVAAGGSHGGWTASASCDS